MGDRLEPGTGGRRGDNGRVEDRLAEACEVCSRGKHAAVAGDWSVSLRRQEPKRKYVV